MPVKANSMHKGMPAAAISPARRFPRNRNKRRHDQQRPFAEVAADGADHVAHQFRAVVNDFRLDAFGKVFSEAFETCRECCR